MSEYFEILLGNKAEIQDEQGDLFEPANVLSRFSPVAKNEIRVNDLSQPNPRSK